jgi:hypothetical protein
MPQIRMTRIMFTPKNLTAAKESSKTRTGNLFF